MSEGNEYKLPNGYEMRGVRRLNFILGKNGSGKSFTLKALAHGLENKGGVGLIRYVTPERGGLLEFDPNVEHQIANSPGYLENSRRVNQLTQFKQQTIAQYRKLEIAVMRKLESALETNKSLTLDQVETFSSVLAKVNTLLDHVEIQRGEPAFTILRKKDKWNQQPKEISSGESELIGLGIECLVFSAQAQAGKDNFLLLDEPDVHLHPDLQVRFIKLLEGLENLKHIRILVATHSTPLIGGLEDYSDACVSFMKFGQQHFQFEPISEIHTRIVPLFGAHPLSQVFNQKPILLVEGEDDERVWQQAVRSSTGRLRLYPCSAGSVDELTKYEKKVAELLRSIYDNPRGFSLRDRDDKPSNIEDMGPLIRMRLECRASENLLLTDEVLESIDMDWDLVCQRILAWLGQNGSHKHYPTMKEFQDQTFPRKTFDLKNIRNDLVGILGTAKPWEVLVGQGIARMELVQIPSEHSLQSYLGEKVVQNLFGHKQKPIEPSII